MRPLGGLGNALTDLRIDSLLRQLSRLLRRELSASASDEIWNGSAQTRFVGRTALKRNSSGEGTNRSPSFISRLKKLFANNVYCSFYSLYNSLNSSQSLPLLSQTVRHSSTDTKDHVTVLEQFTEWGYAPVSFYMVVELRLSWVSNLRLNKAGFLSARP
ncbi:uncharacterized protein YALI1_F16058g [Yarrowia lipolytica]|uniref:Uncharacterized protein n=1 Tax=Yarrowia lipolytica TaxID=4952 RepID=A0A1D8NN19_YARLL|nr:hypothetical protein YALI1_F16058g [Yarrowia lipolytica]